MIRLIAILAGLLLAAIGFESFAFAQQNDRIALVIGNAAYPDAESPLTEPVSDARALGDELRRLGYTVDAGENLKKAAMQQALDRFYAKIKDDSTAVIFFSGFGIQVDRQSFLIPVDAQIWNEPDVRRDGFSLDTIIGQMNSHNARVKVVIIDASRRNPYERRFRSVSEGLAAVTAPVGTVVMSSVPPDTLVSPGNAPTFVPDLIKELKGVDTKIEGVFNRTRVDVSRATKGRQVPWYSSSLEEDYAFAPSGSSVEPKAEAPAAEDAPAPDTADSEAAARHDYVAAEELGTVQGWDDFLTKHKTGIYHELAVEKREKLLTKKVEQPKPQSAPDGPTDLAGYYARGQRRAQDGNYMGAIDDFTEVIKRDPKHVGALNDRCWVRAVIGDLFHATKDCNDALKIAPNYADAFDSRGFVNLKLGELKESIADYGSALRLAPKQASSLYGRGIAEKRTGDVDRSNRDISDAEAIDPKIGDEFRSYGVH